MKIATGDGRKMIQSHLDSHDFQKLQDQWFANNIILISKYQDRPR